MNKGEMILGIIEVFDRAEKAERDLANTSALYLNDSAVKVCAESAADMAIYATGRKKVFEESTYSWRRVEAWRDDDGTVRSTSFEKWRDGKISGVPDYMSKDEFLAYFDPELRAMYEKEKGDAIAVLAVTDE